MVPTGGISEIAIRVGGGALQLPRAGLLREEGPEHKDRLVPEERTLEA